MTGTSRATANDRRFYGVVTALVRRIEDPEGLGRVTVVYPWFDDGRTESDWCRVTQPYAGPDYGAVFVPEEDTEVLVAFEHGDMRFPVVVGGLYNGEQKPPTARKDEDRKMLRTKHGHELVFDDKSGSQAVWLKTKDEHEIKIDDTNGKITATTKNGPSITIDKTGTLTIDTGTGQKITLNGSAVTIEGASVTLSSSQISLGQGASEPLVLGRTFLNLFNSHVHTCTAPGSPSSPPAIPLLAPLVLSNVTKTG